MYIASFTVSLVSPQLVLPAFERVFGWTKLTSSFSHRMFQSGTYNSISWYHRWPNECKLFQLYPGTLTLNHQNGAAVISQGIHVSYMLGNSDLKQPSGHDGVSNTWHRMASQKYLGISPTHSTSDKNSICFYLHALYCQPTIPTIVIQRTSVGIARLYVSTCISLTTTMSWLKEYLCTMSITPNATLHLLLQPT